MRSPLKIRCLLLELVVHTFGVKSIYGILAISLGKIRGMNQFSGIQAFKQKTKTQR